MRPGLPGVFGIYHGAKCIYVGMALRCPHGDDQEHVTHRSRPTAAHLLHDPTQWVYEALAPEIIQSREAQVIAELDPVCNRE